MEYTELNRQEQLSEVDNLSHERDVLIIKHSTRCAISNMAWNRFRQNGDILPNSLPVYYVDVIRSREISNGIAESYGIRHESPQVLLIREGQCVYDASHYEVSPNALMKHVKEV